jgi:hypothetical protein
MNAAGGRDKPPVLQSKFTQIIPVKGPDLTQQAGIVFPGTCEIDQNTISSIGQERGAKGEGGIGIDSEVPDQETVIGRLIHLGGPLEITVPEIQ